VEASSVQSPEFKTTLSIGFGFLAAGAENSTAFLEAAGFYATKAVLRILVCYNFRFLHPRNYPSSLGQALEFKI
jgi:hypothetical protein